MNKKTCKWTLTFFVTLLLLTWGFLSPHYLAVTFTPQQEQHPSFAFLPLEKQDTFQIMYTHSIHLSNVMESYSITRNLKIKQYELMYEDFAVGMPQDALKGETFVQKDGKYFIKNMKRIFSYFDLRTGKVRANHTVVFKNKYYPLSEVIAPGTLVRIQIKKLNLFQIMKGVNILE
jgi:hypothetical protein